MALIVPYIERRLGSGRSLLHANWTANDHKGGLLTWSQSIEAVDDFGAAFESSFISAMHSTEKWWESLFIPLGQDGQCGLSITTWGKKLGVKGSIQVKYTTDSAWHAVVRSKIVSGGYQCLSFVGRETALHAAHSFVSNLHKDPEVATFNSVGFTRADLDATRLLGQGELIGRRMMTGLINVWPISAFMTKATHNGHNIAAEITQVVREISGQLSVEQSDIACSIASTILTMYGGAEIIAKSKASVPVQPEIDRSEVYGGWGSFG